MSVDKKVGRNFGRTKFILQSCETVQKFSSKGARRVAKNDLNKEVK